jgi:hypothetical protein
MGDLPDLNDREIEDLVREIRAVYVLPPADATEARHLVAMASVTRVAADRDLTVRASAHRRRRTLAFKEALMTRTRTLTIAAKLAALSLVAAFATGGLAAAGVIDLPNPLPDQASDRSKAVHETIDGADPAESTGLAIGSDAQPESAGDEGDVGAQANGAEPEEGAGQEFGDSVSDRASGGEPQEGGSEFGESVSDEAKQLVPRPEPEPLGGPETGETHSQQEITPEPQGGPETGEEKSGEHRPER